MLEITPFHYLKGSLNIILDDNPIKMECEGQCIKLTFTSYYGLRKFILCNKSLNQIIYPCLTKDFVEKLRLSYYINDVLIGESNKDLPYNFLGKYMGLENSKFYLKNFIKTIFQ